MAAFLREADSGISHHLEEFNLIGRSQDATIRLDDNGISRQHATIRREGRLYWITDLGSANGSFVNDVARLPTGDRIRTSGRCGGMSYAALDIFLVMLCRWTRAMAQPATQRVGPSTGYTQTLPVKTARPIDPQDLADIESELARHIGPLAKVLVRKAQALAPTARALREALAPSIQTAPWPSARSKSS